MLIWAMLPVPIAQLMGRHGTGHAFPENIVALGLQICEPKLMSHPAPPNRNPTGSGDNPLEISNAQTAVCRSSAPQDMVQDAGRAHGGDAWAWVGRRQKLNHFRANALFDNCFNPSKFAAMAERAFNKSFGKCTIPSRKAKILVYADNLL